MMNTSQRNIFRVVCYFLAVITGLVALTGLISGDGPIGLITTIITVVLVGLGKIVWAGRTIGQLVSFADDVSDIDRAINPTRNTPKKPKVSKPDPRFHW
jgi:hypothetical protein